MNRAIRLFFAAALVAVLPFANASAAPTVERQLTLNANDVVTFTGKSAVGANVNYNGLIDETTEKTCSTNDATTMCEYTLLTLHNPVPEDDEDGRLRQMLTITLDNYSLPSPASDFDMRLYETDAAGSSRGAEVGFSANTDVVDPDEVISLSIQTTRDVPTKHYLLEVAYFTSLNANFRATVDF